MYQNLYTNTNVRQDYHKLAQILPSDTPVVDSLRTHSHQIVAYQHCHYAPDSWTWARLRIAAWEGCMKSLHVRYWGDMRQQHTCWHIMRRYEVQNKVQKVVVIAVVMDWH